MDDLTKTLSELTEGDSGDFTDVGGGVVPLKPLSTAERLEVARRDADLGRQLMGQHYVHGAFAHVFHRLGGSEGMAEWAARSDRNQTVFYRLFANTVPNMMPIAGVSGEVEVSVHPSLVWDEEAEEAEFTEELDAQTLNDEM